MKIKYTVRSTSAGTEYRDVHPEDKKWLFQQLHNVVDFTTALAASSDPTSQTMHSALILGRSKIPRKGNGSGNSITSAAQGIIDNFNSGQYTLSRPQCDIITKAFAEMVSIIPDWEQVEWEQAASVQSIKPLHPSQAADPGIFETLFDLSEYEIVIRKRK